MRSEQVRCDDAASFLIELADGGARSDDELARHVERCLRCQAEVAQHRKVARALGQLSSVTVEPPPQLLADILATLEAAGDHRDLRSVLTRHRAAYVAAATAATAAGAAGAFVLSRSRRTRLSPTG